MARTRKGTPPAYPSGPHNKQARITVTLTSGKRHCLYLGAFGSKESRAESQRVLALMETHGGRYPVKGLCKETPENGKIGKAGSYPFSPDYHFSVFPYKAR